MSVIVILQQENRREVKKADKRDQILSIVGMRTE